MTGAPPKALVIRKWSFLNISNEIKRRNISMVYQNCDLFPFCQALVCAVCVEKCVCVRHDLNGKRDVPLVPFPTKQKICKNPEGWLILKKQLKDIPQVFLKNE